MMKKGKYIMFKKYTTTGVVLLCGIIIVCGLNQTVLAEEGKDSLSCGNAVKLNSSKLTDLTITKALKTIGTKKTTLFLKPGKWEISNTITIPANVCLKGVNGTEIVIAASKKIIINGPVNIPLSQIFYGKGKVVFGPGYVMNAYPQWFGAKADGKTDCTAAIQAAVDTGIATVLFPRGTYKTGSVSLRSDLLLSGKDVTIIPYKKDDPKGPREVFLLDASAGRLTYKSGGDAKNKQHMNRINIEGFIFNGNAEYLINCLGGGVRFCVFKDLAVIGGKGKVIIRFFNDSPMPGSRNVIHKIDARSDGFDYAVHLSRGDKARKSVYSFDNFEFSHINFWGGRDVIYAGSPICSSSFRKIYGGLYKNTGQAVINLDSDTGDWNKGIIISSVHMESWKNECVALRLKKIQYSDISNIVAIRINTNVWGNRAIKLTDVDNCTFSNFLLYNTGQINQPKKYYPRIELDTECEYNRIIINDKSKVANWIVDNGKGTIIE